jgi:Asp-tRNA(Asn)/Glu-tRNA(Gln) amidotransferase B subunit
MMMFAIHHARKDWDPLPTALKLQDLENEFTKRHSRSPTESELAGLASLSRGEVRRLKKLLALPESYRKELLQELDKPRSEQVLTVDHVLEATTAASLLRKQKIVDPQTEELLRRAIVDKFISGVINNTVAPRKLARLARAVSRKEVPLQQAKRVVSRLISDPKYDIDSAFTESIEQVDFEHNIDQLASRVISALEEHRQRGYQIPSALAETLEHLLKSVRAFLKG